MSSFEQGDPPGVGAEPPEGLTERPRPRRFVRTRKGRIIGGVCSGLGDYFGVDPLLIRIAFVGGALFGGFGAGVYLVIVLLVPEEGASRAPIRFGPLWRSGWRTLIGVVALAIAAGFLIHALVHEAFEGPFGVAAGFGFTAALGLGAGAMWLALRRPGPDGVRSPDRRLFAWLALAALLISAGALLAVLGAWLAGTEGELAAWSVVVLGGALVVTAFTGGSRWLALPAIAFALPVAVVSAAGVDLRGGVGERVHRPGSLAELREGYRLGAGRLEVDLRDLQLPAGDTRLRLRLGMGEAVLLVAEEVCVVTRASIGAGYVGALDRESGGLDVDWSNRPANPPPGTPRLVLDGRIGMGALYVVDRPFGGRRRGGPFKGGGWFEPGAYGTNDACRRRPPGARR